MNALRADLLQPLAAVHHTSSPGRASSQCSACRCWPVEVALGVYDGLGLAGGAAREGDQARVLGVELGVRAAASRSGCSPPRHPDRRPGPAGSQRRTSPLRSSHDHQRGRRDVEAHAAGPWRAAARCTAARRSPGGSRRPSSTPTPAGCRPASAPRRRVPRRAPCRRRGEPCARPRPPRRSSTRGARRRAHARRARAAGARRPRRRRGRSSWAPDPSGRAPRRARRWPARARRPGPPSSGRRGGACARARGPR